MTLSHTSGAAQAATTVATPRLASVNLMPPEIAAAARFRRFQLAMGGAVVGAFVVVGALYTHAHSGVSSAQDQFDAAKQQQATLQTTLNSLASVQDVYNQVAAKQAMLSQALGDEIRWSGYLSDLSLKVPDNVWLTNVSATETAGPGTTPAPATGTTAGVGTITFSGTAFSHDDVATWLDVLAKERGFDQAYFSNSTEAVIGKKPVTNFSSSVTLTDAAKSGRYVPKAGS